MAKERTLGKHERLKSKKAIGQLFSEGKKLQAAPLRVLYTLKKRSDHAALLFGAGVSAKTFKKSVDRNRIKRLIREAYRLQKSSLKEKVAANNIELNVFFIYTATALTEYTEVYKKVGQLLAKLNKLVDE